MRRRVLRLSQLVLDLLVLALAFSLAFFARFDWRPPTDMIGRLALTVPYIVLGEYLVMWLFGVPKFSWRHIGLREVWRILAAGVVATMVLVWIRIGLGAAQGHVPYLRHGVIPLGVIAMNFVLFLLGVAGIRVLRRILGEHYEARERAKNVERRDAVPTMMVGAGQGGVLMAKELAHRPDLGLKPVGFLDDDPAKLGVVIQGVPVLGRSDDLAALCEKHGAKQVLITMASAPGEIIRRIARLAEAAELPVKIIPGLFEIAGGRVELARIRPVAIEDLLRRAPVELDVDAIADDLRDRVVLVTGAGGSIGSEICRQVAAFQPSKLLLAERAENNLFHIHRELRTSYPGLDITPVMADVTDEVRMRSIFERDRPYAVFHAAAHKHVPMMEWNSGEAVKNNVFGTKTVADLAHEHGAESFVMISTDKAVNPTSVMGATKRVAEMYVQALAEDSDTRFVTVRFGNVLGSAGSVIPIFKEQIANGGPVTVTHPEMQRYFMTIPEACQLVLQAGSMGNGGEIFILDMGEPVKIVDLARDLIQLSGLVPGRDIEIEFSGMRPGEKLFEELCVDAEHAEKTRHEKIFVGRRPPATLAEASRHLEVLARCTDGADRARVVASLQRCVPEFHEPDAAAPVRPSRPAPPVEAPSLPPALANPSLDPP
ncbi:MAG: nucleoside-diphosphate sugar epimerase/dehydratase [Myxococcota bacterium]|nr:nucleoside-diphosphate sugar epimerase/dehydratase [Myxococcota bacterium]